MWIWWKQRHEIKARIIIKKTLKTIEFKKIKKTMQEIKKLKKMQDNSILPKFTRNQSRSLRISKTSFG